MSMLSAKLQELMTQLAPCILGQLTNVNPLHLAMEEYQL